MRSHPLKGIAVAICAVGLSGSAVAIPITGDIEFTGSVTLDSSLDQADTVTSFFWGPFPNTMLVNYADGTFAAEGVGFASLATFPNSWTFDPSTATSPLWTVDDFEFNLLSSTIVSQSTTFLNVSGTGIVSAPGYDDTYMDWAFTVSNASGETKAQYTAAPSASATAVPDGGSTVAMLGFAIAGLGITCRFLRH